MADLTNLTNRVNALLAGTTPVPPPNDSYVFASTLNARLIALQTITKTGPPSIADVPNGTWRIYKNSLTGRITIWVNDEGVLIDLLSFNVV